MRKLLNIIGIGLFIFLFLSFTGCESNEVTETDNKEGSSMITDNTKPDSTVTEGTVEPAYSSLQIPEFFNFYYELKDLSYTIELSENGENWNKITPYFVRIDPNATQNIRLDQPVQKSPMVYFGMGGKEVKVRLQKAEDKIETAVVHPLSYNIEAQVNDGVATFTLKEPKNVCVEINGDRYDMVYVFANPTDTDAPVESTDNVTVIKPGLKNLPKVGTEVWGGGIRDVRVYDRVITADEIQLLKKGENVGGYTGRWKLENDFSNEMDSNETASTYGNPVFAEGYKGAETGSVIFNGYEDAVYTGKLFNTNQENYTISAWAYLEPGKAGATRVIVSHFLFVRPDGTVGSNIGDWQFAYISDNKFTPGEWHHVVLTKQGNEVTVYIDGESGGTKTRPKQELSIYLGFGAGTLLNGMYVKDNQTLYISPGAVVRGSVMVYGSKNVRICGSGVIDITPNSTVHSYTGITCAYSENVSVEGVIVNNPSSFNFTIAHSNNVNIKNFKCFSSYGASDGINTKASSNISIDGCFLRTNDDTISIYATSVNYIGSTKGVSVTNSTLISDAGHVVNIGCLGKEYGNDIISEVFIDNIDILDSKSFHAEYQGVLSVNAGNDATVKDITFNNIRIEDFRENQLFNVRIVYNTNYNKVPGKSVENILFSNIVYNGENSVPSIVGGYNGLRKVKGVIFDNIMINGKKLVKGDGNVVVRSYTENVTFR